MCDYQVTKREQHVLRNIPFYMHMCRLFAELQWVPVAANRKYQIDGFLSKAFQYSREDVGPVVVDSAEGSIYSRASFHLPIRSLLQLTKLPDPLRKRSFG